MMKVLVCGDRHWTDGKAIYDRLQSLPADTTIIEGGARGADRLAAEQAELLGFAVVEIPARWELHGKAAGPLRNSRMLDMQPDLVIAFHSNLSESKGTRNCIGQARDRGIPIEVIT